MALASLNPRQREAVEHGDEPLLIVAGAGSGKTTTLAHRVAHLIAAGADPGRILLLTFARRAAAELLHRTEGILRQCGSAAPSGPTTRASQLWAGTFHSMAARTLRLDGHAIGLAPDFTILDRADGEDLIDVVRTDLQLASNERRFPKKATCMDIYSRAVNSRRKLEELVDDQYPWCKDFVEELKRLFTAYVDRKAEQAVLDYDDLLLYWHGLLADPDGGLRARQRFDRVLVDEYQDTNALQAEILKLLAPGGAGLTVVGDDAQAIYAFRGATVRNILDFPRDFPAASVVKLEESYRSTPPILEATNRVIGESRERHAKELFSRRAGGERPVLVHCQDEEEQTEFLVRRILELREQGVELKRQAVLFRAAHHSLALELELGRRNVPFHKYGGLRFVEAAHVKDLVAFLRFVENPRDRVAGLRVLLLVPGVGPKAASRILDSIGASAAGSAPVFASLQSIKPPAAAQQAWPRLARLLEELAGPQPPPVAEQVHRVRGLWAELAADRYDNLEARLRDLEQLESVAARHGERRQLLVDLALDPPASTQELAGPPLLDEDWLVLSTIHSAKGLEWDAVYVIHAADGNIPSDMTTGKPDEIEEERRLFYVALSRARDRLYVTFPMRYYARPGADRHSYAQLTRFLPPSVRASFEERPAVVRPANDQHAASQQPGSPTGAANIRKTIRALWT